VSIAFSQPMLPTLCPQRIILNGYQIIKESTADDAKMAQQVIAKIV
jgi:hypothetical protein